MGREEGMRERGKQQRTGGRERNAKRQMKSHGKEGRKERRVRVRKIRISDVRQMETRRPFLFCLVFDRFHAGYVTAAQIEWLCS